MAWNKLKGAEAFCPKSSVSTLALGAKREKICADDAQLWWRGTKGDKESAVKLAVCRQPLVLPKDTAAASLWVDAFWFTNIDEK